eukprot:CAMPEP_0180018942 /NCGR_PEP_ID=MMETSP0984-20121128/20788_1 /TAXON_ID=483367 /ORGANISM="non described non described, Strain CCMP 2436" /LENGTH=34 /DNA_ID= /DNA_START= /DNA_END= /DNA_ORIENTATION=
MDGDSTSRQGMATLARSTRRLLRGDRPVAGSIKN